MTVNRLGYYSILVYNSNMHYDLIVIGGGSGGVPAARTAAMLGINVAIVEANTFGGTCVNRGCVPKKLYANASELSSIFSTAPSYGWSFPSTPSFDWHYLKTTVHNEIKRLNAVYQKGLENANVHIINGLASFKDDNSIYVNEDTYTADRFLIAVGGKPFFPDIPGIQYAISSDEAFRLDCLPQSIAIVGGGYIALEFAGIFNGLGVETHLIIRKERPLRGFDLDIQDAILTQLQYKGITIHTQTELTHISDPKNGQHTLSFNTGKSLDCNLVMMATGRSPNTEPLALSNTSLTCASSGHIQTNDRLETTVPHIYALGDVSTHKFDLTPYAINEARDWVSRTYANGSKTPNDMLVPTAVFSHPPIATIGLTEEEALSQGYSIAIFKSRFRPMYYSLSKSDDETLMKLIVDRQTDIVLGIHLMGKDCPEMIQGFAVALRAGARKEHFDRTVGVHPSSAEELVTMREPSDIRN